MSKIILQIKEVIVEMNGVLSRRYEESYISEDDINLISDSYTIEMEGLEMDKKNMHSDLLRFSKDIHKATREASELQCA